MYDDVINALGSEGEIIDKLTGISMGGAVEYEIDSMTDISSLNLKRGDIVRVETDFRKEKVFSVTKMFDSEKKQFEAEPDMDRPRPLLVRRNICR